MPRISLKNAQENPTSDWEQVIYKQIRSGKVVPVISNQLHNDRVLNGHGLLVEKFAKHMKYPLLDNINLSRTALFSAILKEVVRPEVEVKREYLDFIKSLAYEQAEEKQTSRSILDDVDSQFDQLDFSTLADQLGRYQFGQAGEDPLLILAEFDIPVYLTTSYHNMMEQALIRAGKKPVTAMCCWHPELRSFDDPLSQGDYFPDKDNPLVYHLYGSDQYPESLVLTEDDYHAFLVAISTYPDLIHPRIRQALTASSMMLLGFDLSESDFRALLWGLIKPRPIRQQSVCVLQIDPGDPERNYLNRYMNTVDFKVYWGSFEDYMRDLYQQVKR